MIPPHWPKPANPKLEKVYSALYDAGATFGGGQDWSCPAHEDERASLGVTAGDTQPVIFKCQAGCSTGDILKALGLKPYDISTKVKPFAEIKASKEKKLVDEQKWIYTDEVGHPLIFVKRMNYSDGSKDYRQGNAVTGKVTSVKGIRNTLYNFPAVIRTVAAKGVVWLVEGEKSADALNDVLPPGEVATTQRMGASQPWPDDFTDELRGAGAVRIVADFDKAGFSRALAVGGALYNAKIPVTVWRGAVERKGADIVDHLVAMKSESDLIRLTARDIKTQLQIWESLQDTPDEGEDEDDDVWPNANNPIDVAKQWLDRFHSHPDRFTLSYWRQDLYEWFAEENVWKEIEQDAFMSRLLRKLDDAITVGANGPAPWNPTPDKMTRIRKTLEWYTHVGAEFERVWLETNAPANVLSFRNGNLDLTSRSLSEPTPLLFSPVALPYDYDPDPPKPNTWHWFLNDLWPNDADSIALLQEWFGYVLSGKLGLDKMLVLFGAPRSGKSTIARVIKWLIGEQNVVSPTLKTLGSQYGLAGWLNKPLAVIEDARFNPRDTEAVVELLLAISSGNPVEVQRKYKESLSVVLPSRLMYVSNEYPRMEDASGALHSRFLYLQTTRGHVGSEDRTIPERLRLELPGIMAWALDGMDRINQSQRFTEPSSLRDTVEDIASAQSYIQSFMHDSCTKGGFTPSAKLYEAYQLWCSLNGISYVWNSIEFSRKLNARYPELKRTTKRLSGYKHPVHGYPVTLKNSSVRISG